MAIMVLDIGGTAIKSGLYIDGELTDIRETPTEAQKGKEHVVNRAKEIITDYQQHSAFERIGISTAGQVDPPPLASSYLAREKASRNLSA